ncbi:phenylacetate--CoA ligase family protein [Kosmotoga pacifica]|uniref:AMP-dependent synthetase/ligase domain-containing protein n=1 Tax=Kosmotoga pacifica TaxID=1330330 RepID=A0A0G2ZFU0_9BACT|nr:AMP-binding protein [Kosmotoga pacifica]AKI97668.1 hypothetical protein IX53_07395 [Kosmotoga pacifica]
MSRWLVKRILGAPELRSKYRIPWSWKLGTRLYNKKSFKETYKQEAFMLLIQEICRNSKFYREHLERFNLKKIRTPEDLGDFFTYPEQLESHPEDFVCKKPDIYFETSGSSGSPKKIGFTREDFLLLAFTTAYGLKKMGVKKNDLYLNAYSYGIWVPGLIIQNALEMLSVPVIPVSHQKPEVIFEKIIDYKPTIVGILPSSLIAITKLAEKCKKELPKIRWFQTGAQHIPRETKEWIKTVWGAKTINGYGATEFGGTFAVECNEGKGYHFNDLLFWVEILNPDQNGYGELVVTTLAFQCMPLIRYRIGDITRFVDDSCDCSFGAAKIDYILGRKDNMFKAAGNNFYPKYFSKAVVEGVFLGVEIDTKESIDRIKIRIVEGSKVDLKRLDTFILDTIEKDELIVETKSESPDSHTGRKIPEVIDLRSRD